MVDTMEQVPLTLRWYNYAANEYECRTDAPQTDEEAVQFIPQSPAAQGLYRAHRSIGTGVLEAMVAALDMHREAYPARRLTS